jgi:hypothetical protein
VLGIDRSNRFVRNRVSHCGYSGTAIAGGIVMLNLKFDGDAAIESCDVVDTGISPDGTQMSSVPAVGIFVLGVATCEIADNRIVYESNATLNLALEHRAMWLIGVPAATLNLGAAQLEIAYGGALLSGNIFEGPGRTHLVEVPMVPIATGIPNLQYDLRFEKLTFANNRCDHTIAQGDAASTALLFGSHMIVTGNHVKGLHNIAAMDLGHRAHVMLLANYTTGAYRNAAATTAPSVPPNNFNVQI